MELKRINGKYSKVEVQKKWLVKRKIIHFISLLFNLILFLNLSRKSQHIKTEESEIDGNGQEFENGNGDQPEIWPYDPSEPRYCLCNQVSYGNMVACDNESVIMKPVTVFLLL